MILRAHRPTRHPRIRRSVARVVSINLAVFALAALFEIAGCFAFWIWVRRGATPFVVVLGVVSLIAFALALTRVDSAFAGRAYAAYGGIYIAASLVWLWLVEGQSPNADRPSWRSARDRWHGHHHRVRSPVTLMLHRTAFAVPEIVPASSQTRPSEPTAAKSVNRRSH
jgi:small multidrug resistance family-3 protein